MNTPERSVEEIVGLKEISTHYWIRESKKDSIGAWKIVDMNLSNLHIINDPKYYGFEVIAIPNTPAERQKREEMVEAEVLTILNREINVLSQFRGDGHHDYAREYLEDVRKQIKKALTHPNNPHLQEQIKE